GEAGSAVACTFGSLAAGLRRSDSAVSPKLGENGVGVLFRPERHEEDHQTRGEDEKHADGQNHEDAKIHARITITRSAPMSLPAGSRLGPYEIVTALGAGGMGIVYKARDTRLERIVAIKILPSADPEQRVRFAREARAIAALSHPHICTVYDVGQQDGT